MASARFGSKCDKHGIMDSKRGYKIVYCAPPTSKRKRYHTGCAMCKAEAVKAAT